MLTDTGRVGAARGAAEPGGVRPLLQTLPGLRGKVRGGAGPAVGCGGPRGPITLPSARSHERRSVEERATDAAPRAPVTS